MTIGQGGDILGADLLFRLGVDASGVAAEVSSKLTAAERAVVAAGGRMSSAIAGDTNKATAATLRVVAAQERYSTVLRKDNATLGQRASAQASLITAQRTLARETERTAVATARASRSTGLFAGTVKGFIAGSAGFAIFREFRRGIDEVKEFQAGIAQSQAGIKSTGGVANVTAQQIQNLAGEIQAYSGIEDDAVVSGANLELTFRGVRNEVGKGNDIFTRAIKASADLKVRGFGTLEGSAKTLGKALQDPVAGLTALRRTGVQFTESQTATIEALVQTGDLLGAQRIILKEVETQVGGSARAYGHTLPGEIDKAMRSLETFEQGALQSTAPVLKAFANVAGFFGKHDTARNIALFAGGSVAALAILNKSVKLYGEISANVFRRVPVQIAANEAEAASYTTLAGAADRAAIAKGRASGAGGIGGRAGLSGLVAANPVGAIAAATVGGLFLQQSHAQSSRRDTLVDKLADPAEFAKAKARLAEIDRLAREGGGRADLFVERTDLAAAIEKAAPKARAAAKQAGKDAGIAYRQSLKASAEGLDFATLASFSGGERADNITTARKSLRDAIEARDKATSTLARARRGGADGATADIRIAQLRLQAARDSAAKDGSTASEQASVLSAQQRLNDLRNTGKATANETADAETKVADAIRSQRDAQEKVNEARKALNEAHGISAKGALAKIKADAQSQGTFLHDVRRLVATGATGAELSKLKELDAATPGTLHRIASQGTKAARSFNDSFSEYLSKIEKRRSAAGLLFDGAESLAEKQGERIAAATQRGIVKGMRGFDFGSFFTDVPAALSPAPVSARVAERQAQYAGANKSRRRG